VSRDDLTLLPLRAFIIGCGGIGSQFTAQALTSGVHSHAQAYGAHPRTKLVGVADSDAGRVRDASGRWGVPGSTDGIDSCRRLQPDIVSLCTPDSTHFALARELLSRHPPRLLIVEKPLALTVAQAEELIQLARSRNCALTVNYSRRYSTTFRTVGEELRAGRHGAPLLARFTYGKGLLHNGSHALDLARLWFGEPLTIMGRPAGWGLPGDESFDVEMMFAGGLRVRLDAFDERIATVFELDLLTENSRIRFWLGGTRWELSEVAPSRLYEGYRDYLPTQRTETDQSFREPLADCLRNAVDNAVRHLDHGEPLWCTGEDGLAALRLVEQIRATRT
jgi:predicted dehydrogenase